MKGEIDETGNLNIERAGKLKIQGCPTQENRNCGDWCPLFREPEVSKWMGSIDPKGKDRELNPKDWDLTICRTTIHFDELIDKRK